MAKKKKDENPEKKLISFEDRQAFKENKRAGLMKNNDLFSESCYKKHLFPTGIYSLDRELNGGLPFGKLVEVFGPQSSGKTSVTFKLAEQINNINYETGKFDESRSNPCSVVFIDLENSFDSEWAETLGFESEEHGNNIDSVIGGDTVGDIVKDYIDSDMYSMIVIDSLDSFFPVNVLEGDMETNDMGLRAKTLYRATRRWIVSLNQAYKRNPDAPWRVPIIVMLNHAQPEMMKTKPKLESPGGKAVKFYTVIRIRMAGLTIATSDTKEHGIGKFKAHIVKNKISAAAGTNAEWEMALKDLEKLRVGEIDNVKDIFSDIRAYGLMEQPTTTKIRIFGEEYKTQKEFKERMYSDREFMMEVWNRVVQEVNR